ncbi:MAG: nucleoside hydrolase [Candidatus Promineifilaceae bacterium]
MYAPFARRDSIRRAGGKEITLELYGLLLIFGILASILAITGCSTGQTATPPVTPGTPRDPGAVLPVLFDDDGSQDGTAALAYLLSHPGASIRAITVSYGEAHPDVFVQHLARKLDELGIEGIPLGAGQDAPLAGSNAFPDWLRESSDNFGGLPIPNADQTYPVHDAAELMVEIVNASPEPVIIFVSGAQTNLATALRLDESITGNIAGVYIMGGAVYVPGNMRGAAPESDNEVAGWNIYSDPQAAKEVFASGLSIYLVPLDATNQVTLDAEDIQPWRQGGSTADFALEIYERKLENFGGRDAETWDLMTAAIMLDPSLCGFAPLKLDVITADGTTSGQTVVDEDGAPNVEVCLSPDARRIKENFREVFSASQ